MVRTSWCAVERHLDYLGRDRRELRHFIARFPFQMKNKVAGVFNCPVWSLHQLSTEANDFAPGRAPRLTNSGEGKAFAENLDFGFALGTKTSDGLSLIACGKHRRDEARDPMVVHMDGQLCRLSDTDGKWVFDKHSSEIVPASELAAVQGEEQQEDDGDYETHNDMSDSQRSSSVASQGNSVRRNRPG